jgi:hypothetical protein
MRSTWSYSRRGLCHTGKPMTLIAGANDEQFRADPYAQLLTPAKRDLVVRIISGLDRVDMITNPAGLPPSAKRLKP